MAISKESNCTESACCAILGKTFGKEIVLTTSVPQKPIALSSAVCMNIDQRALENGIEGHNNGSLTYGINNCTVGSFTRSKVSCGGKNNPRRLWWLTILIKGVALRVQLILRWNTKRKNYGLG